VATQEKPQFLERAWQRIQEEVAKGHQAYVVCPRITTAAAEDEEELIEETAAPMANVEDVFHQLASGPLFGLKLAQLHGKLKSDVKDDVMQSFARGEIDVVVATTVIEVGVDVPNASVMVIMDADRFGVSQLHQLRGRVGRGKVPGLCLLVTGSMPDSPARERLDAVASTTDGFELARIDLEQRREGDVLGKNQSGRRSSLRILNVLRDEELIAQAREHAIAIVTDDVALRDHEQLKRRCSSVLNEERADYLEKT
jgi:ATP-dependent DNA helicase RecG